MDLYQAQKLIDVIKEVHTAHGDDLCWMDIDRIFIAAGLPVPDRKVGCKTAMRQNCDRFIDTMCSGGEWKSYAELEKENEELRARIADLELTCQVRGLTDG